MDSKKFHAKKVDTLQMRAIGRTVWAGLYKTISLSIKNCDFQVSAAISSIEKEVSVSHETV